MMLHLSSLLLVATLGQAPAEPAWLDVVPAEADVVVRVRGFDPVRNDLSAMIQAMSAALAAHAGPALDQAAAGFKGALGDAAAAEPFLLLLRGVAAEPGSGPVAFVIRSASQDVVLKAIAGGNAPTLKHEDGGYDSFADSKGTSVYVAKRGDLSAIGPDKVLVASFAKPGAASFTKGLSSASKTRFAAGDIGVCVNVAALATRYADQITKAKDAFMAALDQAGNQGGQAGMMDIAKSMYGGMFDSIKEADALILGLDFAAEGLGVDGELAVKTDSAAAKSIAASKGSDAKSLARLPADAAYFIYMNLDPKSFESLQMMSLKMMSGGKPAPELEAALAKQRGLGRVETIAGVSMAGGMRTINIMNVSDPKALLGTTEMSVKAMTSADSPLNFFKDVKVVPNAETYKGYTFTRTDMVIDKDKFVKLQPNNPAAGAALTAMYGGDKITSWYGVNDTQMIQLMDKSWDSAKAQLDAYLSGEGSVGATPGYKAVRAKLPTQVNVLALVSVQGLVNQLAGQFSAMTNNPNLKTPADMPKEPAILGLSLTAVAPRSYEFHLVVPSPVGAVVEKGLVPIFQSLRGPGN
jgi:hypothetical protein